MAIVKFIPPYNKITCKDRDRIEANTVGQLLHAIIDKYGDGFNSLLDENGHMSRKIVVMVERRNVLTLQGEKTPLNMDTEVIIMEYLAFA